MINFEDVSKKFGTGDFGLQNISFEIEEGDFVFIVGPTGSGKTTLFRLIIRDSLPTEGKISVSDVEVSALPKKQLADFRKKIGVVFQDLKLLADRTVFENVALPLSVSGVKDEEAKQKVEDVLSQVDILEHKDKFPIQLSGGELQRVAIARALVLDPKILLADEPTGNLDMATSWEIVKLLSDINKKGTTVIMATHNADVVKSLNKRVIELDKGMVVKDHNKAGKEKVKEQAKDKEKEEKKDDKTREIETEEKEK